MITPRRTVGICSACAKEATRITRTWFELREEQCAKAVEWRLAQTVLPFEGAS